MRGDDAGPGGPTIDLASVPVPAVVLGGDAGTVAANDPARRLLGGDGFGALVDALDDEGARRLRELVTAAAAEPEATVQARVRLRSNDRARVRTLEVSMRSLGRVDGDGRATTSSDTAALALLRDATDEVRTRALLEQSATGTSIIDTSGDFLWGPVGPDLGETVVGNAVQLVHPDDLVFTAEGFSRVLEEPGRPVQLTVRSRNPTDPDLWSITTARLTDLRADPDVGGIALQVWVADTERVLSLGRTNATFESLAAVTPVGIVVGNPGGLVVYTNELAQQLLEMRPNRSAELLAAVDPDHASVLGQLLDDAQAGHRAERTLPHTTAQGGTRWLAWRAVPRRQSDGDPAGWIASILDVTTEVEATRDLEAARERLWELATCDPLTGLWNRRHATEALEDLLAATADDGRPADDGNPVWVLFCDLDGFKAVNDELGHEAGDAALVEVAGRLRRAVRDHDVVARFGGDEFVVICTGRRDESDDSSGAATTATAAEVEALAERILEAMRAPFVVASTPVSLGISIGVASTRETGHDAATEVLQRADAALYDAKRAGKDRVVRR